MKSEPIEIKILKAGLMSTIQDSGRVGHQAFGVPIAGPMDRRSAQNAQDLVGNSSDAPILEITLLGPSIQFYHPARIAITGGTIHAQFNGQDLDMNRSIDLKTAGILSLGRVTSGCRVYLGIAGSWQVNRWLNSVSWFSRETTPESWISSGQVLRILRPQIQILPPSIHPVKLDFESPISCFRGPEFDLLSSAEQDQLLNQSFQIESSSNRMAYRLSGRLNANQAIGPMLSVAVLPGTVQLTPSGDLILLMMDAQTTGGYPRILQVASTELDRLGQFRPGDSLRFRLLS